MKVLTYCTGWLTHTNCIADDAKADAAYAAIQAAMNSYDRFGNDKTKTITIDTGAGCSATVVIEHVISATLDDCAQMEADIIERRVWEASIKAKITARLAPAP